MIFKLFGKSKVPKGDINVMKRTLFLSILIVFFTTSFLSIIGCNNQTPTKEQSSVSEKRIKEDYDLQERCGNKSEEILKVKYHSQDNITIKTDDGVKIYEHRNHYNKKMNKCFQIIKKYYGNEKGGGAITKELFDINENRTYGLFWNFWEPNKINDCHVSNNKCSSEEEWDKLVKPYMEE